MAQFQRPVYRRAELQRLLDPRSIAIVGASPRVGSFADRVLTNLARYEGRIFPVNAKYQHVGDHPCFPSLAALPESPDCVVVAVGREGVEEVVRDCIAVRAGGAIVFASGYTEVGRPERAAQQSRLAAVARDGGLPIVGPNSIGLCNLVTGAQMTFSATPVLHEVRGPTIGLVSQSGALGFALTQAVQRGVSLSHTLTSGNSCDVDVADFIAYLAEDPACHAIACLFEGMAEPARLMRAAELAWAADKPLVIYKMATGETGRAAALTHTGSLAGADDAYAAAFARCGAIRVDRLESLIETAAFFAKAATPAARGVAVIATSGGAAIMAADKAELHGVELPQPEAAAHAILAARIPEYGSPRNPCDVTAQVLNDPTSLEECAGALLGDAQYGALVVPQVFAYDFAMRRLPVISRLARQHGKIACNVWLTEWLEGPGAVENESDAHVALFRSMDRCFATLAAWHRRADKRAAGVQAAPRSAPAAAAQTAAERLRAAPGRVIGEHIAKRVLESYGIAVVGEALVGDPDEAVAAAMELGFPVVLKVESPDILHKTEAGVLRLGLRDAATVRAACGEILERARGLGARVDGVLVQPMLRGGVEVMVGGRIDPLFGPLVVVGMGGVLVELLRDRAVALAPVSMAEALGMLRGLKAAAAFDGSRGGARVDLAALADSVVRISECIADQRDLICEIDVNPLICEGARIVAVDGLIIKGEGGSCST